MPPAEFTPTERQLREAAAESYFNARNLHAAAATLERHGHKPQALALAIIGFEELAKAAAYVHSAVRSDFSLATPRALRDHRAKHLVALKAAVAAFGIGDPAEGTAWDTGFRPTREHKVFFLLHLCSDALSGPLLAGDDEGFGLQKARLKEAALYVDLTSGSLRLPTSTAAVSSVHLDQLGWLLDRCSCLSDLVRNDVEWDEIASAVRSVLPPQGA
jgi:AbiV family abortive infection protein